MMLKHFTETDGVDIYVNPAHVASVQPFRHYNSKSNTFEVRGTLIRLITDQYSVHVSEDPSYVVAALQGAGVCRECHQLLDESWKTMCRDCLRNAPRVDANYEAARADLVEKSV